MNTPQTPPVLLDEIALASALSVSIAALRKDRQGSRSIPFLRIGKKSIRYDLARVLEVLRTGEQGGPAQPPQRAKRGSL